jgi:hypothetical protein
MDTDKAINIFNLIKTCYMEKNKETRARHQPPTIFAIHRLVQVQHVAFIIRRSCIRNTSKKLRVA